MNASYDFSGKHYVVAGGASGMGRSFAEKLADAGATVFIVDLNKAGGDEFVAQQAAKGRKAYAYGLNACDLDAAIATAAEIAGIAGKIDGMVSSVGIGAGAKEGESLADTYNRMIAVSLQGMFNVCHAFGEEMIKTGGGTIVNICSQAATIIPRKNRPGRGGEYGLIGYCTAKGGVKLMTKAMAILWAGYGMRANTVSPGYVDTPLTAATQSVPEIRAAMEATVPLGYLAAPSDIDGTVMFLLSEDSRYVTGQDFLVDGGCTSM